MLGCEGVDMRVMSPPYGRDKHTECAKLAGVTRAEASDYTHSISLQTGMF